jgi:hypothetical protein
MASTSSKNDDTITFDGSSWESLTRLVTQAKIALILDDDVTNQRTQSAWLAARFRGPALDWFGRIIDNDPAHLDDFNAFVWSTREQFGISDDGLRARRRGQLEELRWHADVPLFFAEFDRLTSLLMVAENETRIALVRAKLPTSIQKLLAEQALDFANYETMRERLLTMWALDPNRNTAVGKAGHPPKRPKCGRCGKRGHAASDCRGAAKN